jgi:acyl carrier protein
VLAVEGGRKDEKMLVLVIEESVLFTAGLQSAAVAKNILQDTLLPSMLPAIVLQVPVFPRNTSGKLDRKELQRSVEATFLAEQASTDPRDRAGPPARGMGDFNELSESDVAARILEVYTTVLNCKVPQDADADVDSLSFFALGGDSVTLIEVLWNLRQWTGLSIKPADIHRSVPDLARYLRSSVTKTGELVVRASYFAA